MSRIYTVGHSTRSLDGLVEILRTHGIERLVDVRRFPGSRRHPHFAREALASGLAAEGIDYRFVGESLGGRRRAGCSRLDSPNAAWTVEGFRTYADYMQTEAFLEGLRLLEDLARERPTAFMCAEALWSRCHRRLIADALLVRGWEVVHLSSTRPGRPHALPAFAVVDGERLSYPATGSAERG